MSYCTECGSLVPVGHTFCGQCGTRHRWGAAPREVVWGSRSTTPSGASSPVGWRERGTHPRPGPGFAGVRLHCRLTPVPKLLLGTNDPGMKAAIIVLAVLFGSAGIGLAASDNGRAVLTVLVFAVVLAGGGWLYNKAHAHGARTRSRRRLTSPTVRPLLRRDALLARRDALLQQLSEGSRSAPCLCAPYPCGGPSQHVAIARQREAANDNRAWQAAIDAWPAGERGQSVPQAQQGVRAALANLKAVDAEILAAKRQPPPRLPQPQPKKAGRWPGVIVFVVIMSVICSYQVSQKVGTDILVGVVMILLVGWLLLHVAVGLQKMNMRLELTRQWLMGHPTPDGKPLSQVGVRTGTSGSHVRSAGPRGFSAASVGQGPRRRCRRGLGRRSADSQDQGPVRYLRDRLQSRGNVSVMRCETVEVLTTRCRSPSSTDCRIPYHRWLRSPKPCCRACSRSRPSPSPRWSRWQGWPLHLAEVAGDGGVPTRYMFLGWKLPTCTSPRPAGCPSPLGPWRRLRRR